MRYLGIVLVWVLLFTGIAIAQDDTTTLPEGCATEDFTALLTEQSDVLAEADDLDLALRDLINTLSIKRADCAGLLFSNT